MHSLRVTNEDYVRLFEESWFKSKTGCFRRNNPSNKRYCFARRLFDNIDIFVFAFHFVVFASEGFESCGVVG